MFFVLTFSSSIVAQEIFKRVEQMPRFPGCEHLDSNPEKARCAEMKFLKYIYKNLKYPKEARENGLEGTVVLQFVVADDGFIEDVNISRDIGMGCGEAAIEVIESMNEMEDFWTPGRQRGKTIYCYYTIPIRFKIDNKD